MGKPIRIVHCADVHVKNLKYHDEQRQVFEKFHAHCRELSPDHIIIAGDVFHSKSRISAEAFMLVADFLRTTAGIAETHVIVGNHDTVLSNKSRMDSLTPIVSALSIPNLKLYKESGEYDVGGGVVLNVFSLLDKENWVTVPTDKEKINIAVFHGAIVGTKTETGWAIEHGDALSSTFSFCDYGMFGDIHGDNIPVDILGTQRYAGSLIQQNHGEFNTKGFLYWEIEDKRKFKCKHVHIPNPKPFITVTLTPKGNLPRKIDVPSGARLRIVSETAIPFEKLTQAGEIAKRKWDLESVTFLSKAPRFHHDGSIIEAHDVDLRDIEVQEELIRKYLSDYEIGDDVLEKVFALNMQYNTAIADEDDVKRYVRWGVEGFQWDNLFMYGKDNYIDFTKLGGVVGIFGKNWSGKSSAVDSLLYTIFNTTSKNEKKSVNVVNQNKESANGTAVLTIGDERYAIRRDLEKYQKTLKGKTTTEAKTKLTYYRIDGEELIPLNGETRNETDKLIRRQFGTIDDFLLTAFASQHGALSYINEGSTKRKEILAKFLDLQMFEQKFKLAKEHSDDLRATLRKLEADGTDYEAEIRDAEWEIARCESAIEEAEVACQTLEEEREMVSAEIAGMETVMQNMPEDINLVRDAKQNLPSAVRRYENVQRTLASIVDEIEECKIQQEKFEAFFGAYESEGCDEKYEKILELQKIQGGINMQIEALGKDRLMHESRIDLLTEVPCKGEYDCKFIADANASKKTLPGIIDTLDGLHEQRRELATEIADLKPDKVFSCMEKHKEAKGKLREFTDRFHRLQIDKGTAETAVATAAAELSEIRRLADEYEKHSDAIENMEEMRERVSELGKMRKKLTDEIEQCKADLFTHHKAHGAAEQKLMNLQSSLRSLDELRESYSAYDLFLRCMHPSGISYEIIKQKLPIINEEIAKILANVVNFEVFFENDDNKLNIHIRHPKYDKRPIELGSGAEKTLAAIAIRMALLDITSLPVPNFFVLDEPATDLDEDNLEGFTRILDIIKSKFEVVFLISHLESLKDSADMHLPIIKTGGYAKLQH